MKQYIFIFIMCICGAIVPQRMWAETIPTRPFDVTITKTGSGETTLSKELAKVITINKSASGEARVKVQSGEEEVTPTQFEHHTRYDFTIACVKSIETGNDDLEGDIIAKAKRRTAALQEPTLNGPTLVVGTATAYTTYPLDAQHTSITLQMSASGKLMVSGAEVDGTVTSIYFIDAHQLTATPATDATCTSAGNKAYWYCSVCERYFSDAGGKKDIVENSWIIPATAHTFDANGKCTTCGGQLSVTVTTSAGAVTRYTTFAAALADAPDGSTITLLEDVTIESTDHAIAIAIGKNRFPNGITFDLNNHSITTEYKDNASNGSKSFHIYEGNKVTIKNGELIAKNYACEISSPESPLTLENVKIDGSLLATSWGNTKLIDCAESLTCNNCTIKAKEGDQAINAMWGMVVLTGTTTVEGDIRMWLAMLRAANTVTISNCHLYADEIAQDKGALSIAGGDGTTPTGFSWVAGTDGLATLFQKAITISDNAIFAAMEIFKVSVVVKLPQDITFNRTLYKDGYYNTLCLPFSLTAQQLANGPWAGCTLMEVTGASMSSDGNTMTIQLTQVNALEAGKPYLIKWETGENIDSQTFKDVMITTVNPSTFSGTNLDVVGTFEGGWMKSSDTNLFFLGAENKFYTSNDEYGTIKGFRCYFRLKGVSGGAKALNFVIDDETTTSVNSEQLTVNNGAGAMKHIENGRVVILRGGKKYNVNGQVIK